MRPSTIPASPTEAMELLRATGAFAPLDAGALRQLAEAMEWWQADPGEVLVQPGQLGAELSIVFRGRARVYAVDVEGEEPLLVDDLGYAGLLPDFSVVSGEPSAFRILATRETELARLPAELLSAVAVEHPELWRQVAVGALRYLRRARADASELGTNVAILPADPQAPLTRFTEQLTEAMAELEGARRVDAAALDEALGEGASDDDASTWDELDRAVLAWVSEQERTHRYVLYEAHPDYSPWTRRCIRFSDRLLIVARAVSDPSLTAAEREVFDAAQGTFSTRELVLLHDDDVEVPSGTEEWLARRPGLDAVHHVKLSEPEHLRRLARVLTGRAVGLVLGGGGARGCAHIGVIRALRELGVPIDYVGGTSAGGGIAAMVAAGRSVERMTADSRVGFIEMAPFHAFDLPYHSLMQTEAVEAPARWLYGTLNIEDLWLPFFCISCDLASAEMVVHRRGRVWKAVRATTCLPVVLPPMHLRGRVLVDGGVVDNTPIETMRRLNPGPNILVNVSPDEDDLVGDDVLALPANRQVVAWRLHPLLPSVEVPNLASVIVRTMTVSSSGHQPEKLADLTLRPAIDGYGVVDFEAIDELVALGYNAAMEVFEARADDAAFLGRFGLVPEQVVAPLPRVEVPYWQGIARRKRAARKRVALQSALGFVVALVLGAVFHTLWSADQPWLPTLVGALVIGLVPPLRALSAREAT